MPQIDPQKVARYVEYADATIASLRQQIGTQQTKTAAVNDAAKTVAAHIADLGLVDKAHQAKLAERLQDPAYGLEQITFLADALVEAQRGSPKLASDAAPRLGVAPVESVGSKTAGAARPRGVRVPSAADLQFVKDLGLSPEYA